MAIESVTGTEYNDWLDGGDGENVYEGMAGDDWINGADGQNTIVYNLGDGIDTISYAPPRTYQFAGFLEEVERALAQDSFAAGTSYSNSYFSDVSSALYDRLPASVRDVLNGFRSTFVEDVGMVAGTVDGAAALAAFSELRDWINAPVTNVVEFGAGITLADLTVQASATSSFDAPSTFSVSVGGDQGVVFNMVPPDLAAASSTPTEVPPMDIIFRFADGTTATLAEVLALADDGVAGYSNGSDASEVMSGSLADDQIYGNGGDDQIDGRAGMDYLSGGSGNDVIAGGAGGDLIYGDDGDDVIAGGRDGATVGGGAGNDVYLFNMGDGALFVDNTPGVLGGEVDTLSFGAGVAPENVVAYVDEYGTLTLMVQGTSDQVLINWFMNNYDGTYSLRPDQVVPRVQFVDASGNVRVFDLADLVGDRQGDLFSASAASPIHLFGTAEQYGQYELVGAPVAGGEYATRYAVTGDMFAAAPPPGNHAPEAGVAIGNQSAVEGQSLSITIPAGAFTDADGDTLSFSAALVGGAGLPAWLQFNSQTGQFTGTPDDAEVAAGTLSIQVTASDGQGGQAMQTFELSMVSVNDAPQAAAPSVSAQATEDAVFQFALPAGFFSDADAGEVLSVSADAADLPAWLTFDAASMTFSGTPTNGDVGAFSVTVTATDSGGLRTSTEVAISVANTNDAPTVANEIGNYVIDEDTDFSMQVPANVFADVDAGDSLGVSLEGLPQWATYDAATGTISGTPGNGDVGSYTLTLVATDAAGASAQESFNITVVNVNDAPTVVNEVGNYVTDEDAAFSMQVPANVFADVDADDSLSVSLEGLPQWVTYDAATGMISGTPGNGDVGSFTVTLVATDAAGASAQESFNITVVNVNDAPTLDNAVADQAAVEDAAFSFTVPAGTFSDVDADDVLTLSASALPEWLSFDAASGTFSGTASNGDVGGVSVTVTATDSAGASASSTFQISVANSNDAPTLGGAMDDQVADEGSPVSFSLPAGMFADVDQGDVLTLTASMVDGSELPSWLTFDAANGSFSGTPGWSDAGTLSIRVTATDGSGASVSDAFDLSIANANAAPVGVPTISGTPSEDQTLTVDTSGMSDADGLGTFSYQWLRDGSALAGATASTYTLDDADVGSQMSVQVSYTDAQGTSEGPLASVQTAPVENVNDAPVGVPVIGWMFSQVQRLAMSTLATSEADGPTFAEGQTLTVDTSLITDPDGLGPFSFQWLRNGDAITGATDSSYTLDDADVGSLISVRVSYTDGHGTAETLTSMPTTPVLNVNDAPEGVPAISGMATAGQTLTAGTSGISDGDGVGAFSYQWLRSTDGGTTWIDIGGATASTYTLGDADVGGQMSVRVSYTDGHGTAESLISAQTGPVLDAEPAPDPDRNLRGGRGNDMLVGGSGNDTLAGRGGKDVLLGGAGNDTLMFYRDSSWRSNSRRTHNGSPGVDGTGASVSISGKRRSYDIFNGGEDVDTLLGSGGSDAILLDDASSSALEAGPRIVDVEVIDARDGDDLVDLTSQRYAYGDVTIRGGTGNDTLWSSSGNDALYGDSGNDSMDGGAGNDYLSGGSGRDTLRGGNGIDLLQGGSGDDNLSDWGRALLDAGSGNDTIGDGAGNSMIIGGQGNDSIQLGGGFDVVAFNRGDGRDVVESGNGGSATLSLGSGIRIQDLAFRRSGRDLVLETGNRESITLEDWYRGRQYQAVTTLQLITAGMSGPSTLHDDPIESFDFRGLVSAFDAASRRNPGLSKWALTNSLASFDLGGSDDAVLGGDLAYQYGVTGSLAGIAVGAAQDVVGASDFGSDTQRLQAFQVLEDGLVKLA